MATPREAKPRRFDVVALGELVIDLVPPSPHDRKLFIAKPGGAPGNVAAGVARLGRSAAMISRVGPGALGRLLIETLAQAGVETGFITHAPNEPTALAVVSLNADGERDFILYREGCADASLTVEDLPLAALRSTSVLHVGSLSLATPPSAAAQRRAVGEAADAGAWISVDVNFRPALWRDHDAMRRTGLEAIAAADVAKVSAEELALLTGLDEVPAAVERLWHPGMKLLALTKGGDGAELFTATNHVVVPGFTVPIVDTVGCGDAFMAALLAGLVALHLELPRADELFDLGRRACAAGAVMAGIAGAMEAMPRQAEIEALMRSAGAPIMARTTEPFPVSD